MNSSEKSSSGRTIDWMALVREKVEGLRYGVVQIVVHDGRITLIERTEKTRLDEPTGEAPPRRPRV